MSENSAPWTVSLPDAWTFGIKPFRIGIPNNTENDIVVCGRGRAYGQDVSLEVVVPSGRSALFEVYAAWPDDVSNEPTTAFWFVKNNP